MNIKKLLPFFLLVSLIAGGISQSSFAKSLPEPAINIPLSTTDEISVCSDIVLCDYTSIQDAIDNAGTGDIILLSSETFTETIQLIDEHITIRGNGPENTIIQAHANPGSATSSVIEVNNQASLTIEDLTIRHGYNEFGNGGGIWNKGSLAVHNSLITNNIAVNGGGIANVPIASNQATITVTNSTIANNDADVGGGIFNTALSGFSTATAFVQNSLIYNNAAENSGGGVANIGGNLPNSGNADITMTNVTFSNNFTGGGDSVGGAFYNESGTNPASATIRHGTFVDNTSSAEGNGNNFFIESGSVTLANSILANENGDCSGSGSLIDGGYNLVKHASCGTPTGGIFGLIETLADNGGDTQTYALREYSPALDLVPPGVCLEDTDQRDVPRPFGAGCDSGAFELDATSLTFKQNVVDPDVKPGEIVTFTITAELTGPGISNGTITTNAPENLTFLEASQLDPPNSGIISTPPTLTHSIVISANQMITLTVAAEVVLGLPIGTPIYHEVYITSNEFTEPTTDFISLNVINAPPVALDDNGSAFTTTPDKMFITGNVLDNDYDPNNDPLDINVNTSGLLGNLINNLDGTFSYDPNHQFDGLPPGSTQYDTFQYLLTDGNGGFSEFATVTITIRQDYEFIYLPLITNNFGGP
jgi:VCBS repeat-containing protein